MSIYNTIQRIRQTPLFKENLWEVSVISPDLLNKNFPNAYLFAQGVEFPPMYKFTTERNETSQKEYYREYEAPNTLSISFIETEDLQVTEWLEKWESYYFNKNTRTYRVGRDPRVSVRLRLQRFGLVGLALNLASIGLGQATGAFGVPPEITGALSGFGGVAGGAVTSKLSIPPEANSIAEGLETTKEYKFKGCRFKDRTDWTLRYDGEELNIITVNFSVEEQRSGNFI